jgi:hypothetical protein
MKRNVNISHNDGFTKLELSLDYKLVDTCFITWNTLNVPKIDAIAFKLRNIDEHQATKIKELRELLMKEENKLNSIHSIQDNLKQESYLLRKQKGVLVQSLATGEEEWITSEMFEELDADDYKLLQIGEFVTKEKKELV